MNRATRDSSVRVMRPVAGMEVRTEHVRRVRPAHLHEDVQIGLVERGSAWVETNEKRWVVEAGALVVWRPFEVHAVRPHVADGFVVRVLDVSKELFATVCPADALERVSGVPVRGAVVDAFREAHRVLEGDVDEAGAHAALAAIGVELQRLAEGSAVPQRAPERRAVKVVREHVEARFNESVSLAQIAALAGLSRFHLIRVFREATGLPPHAYQLQVRIVRAKPMLRAGRSLSDVAVSTGFADQSHFSRQFRRALGVTPGQYARACAEAPLAPTVSTVPPAPGLHDTVHDASHEPTAALGAA